jgi:predicted cobalt transporter CbtA
MMYLVVVLTAAGILVVYYLIRLAFKINLRYGMVSLLLILMPHAIGIYKSLDSSTCTVTLLLSLVGIFILIADISQQKQKLR